MPAATDTRTLVSPCTSGSALYLCRSVPSPVPPCMRACVRARAPPLSSSLYLPFPRPPSSPPPSLWRRTAATAAFVRLISTEISIARTFVSTKRGWMIPASMFLFSFFSREGLVVKGLDLDFLGRIRGATIRLRCFVTGMEFEQLLERFYFILFCSDYVRREWEEWSFHDFYSLRLLVFRRIFMCRILNMIDIRIISFLFVAIFKDRYVFQRT